MGWVSNKVPRLLYLPKQKGKVNKMALQTRRRVMIEGESVINGVVAQGYRAEINEVDPKNSLNMSDWIADKDVYKANRTQVRADSHEFEDAVFALQDEMIAALGATEEE